MLERHLTTHPNPGHALLVVRQLEVANGLEELEPDAALLQHLIDRREDHVHHASLHLVKDVATIGEQHPHHGVQNRSGRDRRVTVVRGIFHRKDER